MSVYAMTYKETTGSKLPLISILMSVNYGREMLCFLEISMFSLNQKGRVTLAVIGLVVGITGVASADEVHFVGKTLGSFNGGAFLPATSIFDLAYSNSNFDNSTVGNFLDLGGNPNPGLNFNNLGSFTLGNTNQNYNGNTFVLQVDFTAPVTITGGSTVHFTDQIFGTVFNGNGGVFIDFDNTPQTFNFSNATAAGSFTMFVNDVSISPGQSASLTGRISATQAPVPEPATLVALAVGGVGLLRRRRQASRI